MPNKPRRSDDDSSPTIRVQRPWRSGLRGFAKKKLAPPLPPGDGELGGKVHKHALRRAVPRVHAPSRPYALAKRKDSATETPPETPGRGLPDITRKSTATVMVRRDARETIFCGVSEFGLLLAELIERDVSFMGAILTDDEGNPVDYARRPDRISLLDLQITGAQIERCVTTVDRSAARFDLGAPSIVVEASHGLLIAKSLCTHYVLVARIAPVDDIRRVLERFHATGREITNMIEA